MYPKSCVKELRIGKPKKMFSENIESSIDKQPVNQLTVKVGGIVGNRQSYLDGHKDRKVLQFDSEHYEPLKKAFPNAKDCFVHGAFGENIVAANMNEHNICIGDIVEIGSVILEVAQPREPCFKLNYRFNELGMSHYAQVNAKTGWFYRIIKEGYINVGDGICVINRPYPQWCVAKIQHYLYVERDNKFAAELLSKLPPLTNEINDIFAHRLENYMDEDWSDSLTDQGWDTRPVNNNHKIEVNIIDIINESDLVKRFVLSPTDATPLSDFKAGAHITLNLPNGLLRTYSMCAPLADNSYQVSVGFALNSRGGSKYLHEEAQVGDLLTISQPANMFEMTRDRNQIFIAAGIGITPMLTMIHEAKKYNESFELHYCVDDENNYAFQEQLSAYSKHLFIYSLNTRLDLTTLLNTHSRGSHVYTCGSPGFVNLVIKNTSHWNDNNVHYENFSVDHSSDSSYVIKVKGSDQEVVVDSNVSMLEALRNSGFSIESSCETGICGKCKVKYFGEVDHNDTILSKSERKKWMTSCVSRAKNDNIEISFD